MSTVIRANISQKNLWWIPKHRYYELKHFCMQYPDWRKERSALRDLAPVSNPELPADGGFGRPVENLVERMTYFNDRIVMVEEAAKLTDDCIGEFILKAVISGKSYDAMYALRPIPCCRDIYYELYRKFFYILNRLRG